MRTPDASPDPDRALKDRHRKLWALGNYGAVAGEVIPGLGAALVEEAGIGPGDYVLDVAAGTGNAAIPAAMAGASVVAVDLTPELLQAGKDASGGRMDLEWVEGDAENLPFEDGVFDAVISCVGVMFAPNHVKSAAELSRVCKPGGTVALLNWTPEGFIGEMFGIMRDYQPTPPPGAASPPMWGSEDYIGALLDGLVDGVATQRATVTVDRFTEPDHFRDFFKANYGPTMGVYRGLGGDAERTAALDRELSGLAERHARTTDAGIEMDWEYLLLRGTGRGGT
ncbi:methyltransferase domain-containing protein [Arthrobacter sp. Helios]|uniref:class I SAM-dependent methyltransferase n=1 Tax=Arthrobacter sp. Helios TaxID=2828862 RepID=UPI002051DDC6|nr:methyltransferase domain-containing protein [Arthrobacter sp. Helios]UPO78177.1 methyltransferase domain-containing protein [Arthrobacter sp. Helios]